MAWKNRDGLYLEDSKDPVVSNVKAIAAKEKGCFIGCSLSKSQSHLIVISSTREKRTPFTLIAAGPPQVAAIFLPVFIAVTCSFKK